MTGKKFRPMHKASRVQELPQPASPICSSGKPQSPARRPERRAVTRRSGPEHTEAPPIKERPAVGGRNPRLNHLERFRGRTRGSPLPESRANRGPREVPRSPELDTRHHMRTSNDDDHRAVGTPYRDLRPGEPGIEATRRRRRQRQSRRSSTKRGCSSIQSRRAHPNSRPRCRSNRSYPTL